MNLRTRRVTLLNFIVYGTLWCYRYSQLANLKSRHAREIRDEGPCARRPMRVKMGKSGPWKHVILPKFYDSYRCGGDCKFPLDDKVS